MLENDKEITDLIRKLIPINELTEKIQNKVISNAELIDVKKGKYLFRKGDRDHFSYYLLSGKIDLVSDRQIHDTIEGGSDRAKYAMAQLQPRQFSALAKSNAQVFKVNRTVLDKLMLISKESPDNKVDLSDTISGPGQLEVNEIDEQEEMDWMSRLLQSELFMKIPSGNIQKLFGLLESDEYKSGQVVIEQGQEGEHYYIIQEGKCVVTRQAGASSNPIKLAELKVGDSFGEESLLMDTKCNATVSMATDGVLMRLSKSNFIELIKKPTLQTIGYAEALELTNAGAKWLDVRFESEHEEVHINNSLHIPLNLLRTQIKKLDPDNQYIIYCDSGARSSAAAFLMTERGYKALYLDGGLISHHDILDLVKNNQDAEISEQDESNQVIEQEDAIDAETESDDLEPSADTEENDPNHEIPELEANNSDSGKEELEKMKQDFKLQMDKEKKALQEKYTEAQRMLDKAKLIRQEAEKAKQKIDDDISKRNSVIELSQQKILKEMESKIESLESTREKVSDKNKNLLAKRVELEKELQDLKDQVKKLFDENKLLKEENEKLAETTQEAQQQKLKALQDTIKAKQEAKKIIEIYKEKHKQLYEMEEEIIQHELQTLDENNEIQEPDLELEDPVSDNNLKELNMLKTKNSNLAIDVNSKKPRDYNSDKRDDTSEKLLQEISSQLGQSK